KKRCSIQIYITTVHIDGGSTTFTFATKPINREMKLTGTLETILLRGLPHEITHTVIADHFGQPVPRWADEGIALMSEDPDEQKRHLKTCCQVLNAGRGIPLRKLLPMREYPADVPVLYSEGV